MEVGFKVEVTVPTEYVGAFTKLMNKVGITVLNTGNCITTEAGLDAEVDLELMVPSDPDLPDITVMMSVPR